MDFSGLLKSLNDSMVNQFQRAEERRKENQTLALQMLLAGYVPQGSPQAAQMSDIMGGPPVQGPEPNPAEQGEPQINSLFGRAGSGRAPSALGAGIKAGLRGAMGQLTVDPLMDVSRYVPSITNEAVNRMLMQRNEAAANQALESLRNTNQTARDERQHGWDVERESVRHSNQVAEDENRFEHDTALVGERAKKEYQLRTKLSQYENRMRLTLAKLKANGSGKLTAKEALAAMTVISQADQAIQLADDSDWGWHSVETKNKIAQYRFLRSAVLDVLRGKSVGNEGSDEVDPEIDSLLGEIDAENGAVPSMPRAARNGSASSESTSANPPKFDVNSYIDNFEGWSPEEKEDLDEMGYFDEE
jgi:hypothetical protein